MTTHAIKLPQHAIGHHERKAGQTAASGRLSRLLIKSAGYVLPQKHNHLISKERRQSLAPRRSQVELEKQKHPELLVRSRDLPKPARSRLRKPAV